MVRSRPSSPVISFSASSSSSGESSDWTVVWRKSSCCWGTAPCYSERPCRTGFSPSAGDGLKPVLHLRCNQSEVVVPPLVNHRDPVVVEIAEDDELVLRLVEPQRRF